MKRYTIGVDVGGTNIKLGLVDRSGVIVTRAFLDTKNFYRSKTKLIDAIVGAVRDLIDEERLASKDILGIGLGLPGPIDSRRGVVNFLPNIPGWKNVPLKSIIQKKLHIPTSVDNDVNLITLGEWKFGAGKGYKNLMCMTLGTGVGGGLILNDALYRGEGFVAGELGHMPLNEKGPDCNCGGSGCFEYYVGNGYLLKKAVKIFKNKNIQLPDVFHLAKQGNMRAIRFWEETAVHIGNALVGVINLLNLRLIVIGGGVSNNYSFLGKTINAVIKRRAMKVQSKMVKIVRAKLGNDAGIKGAQILVKEAIRER
ncbi:MAG: ROK family protein [Candidatus Omnitrophica bacterium]|nr:ROK family protein [Candidatus Omnitrophota bacterium]